MSDDSHLGQDMTPEEMRRLHEKHVGTAEEIAFHQRRGAVCRIDLDAGRFHVAVNATEEELRRIAPLMLAGEVVSVILPAEGCRSPRAIPQEKKR
jgi:hypothetical protein